MSVFRHCPDAVSHIRLQQPIIHSEMSLNITWPAWHTSRNNKHTKHTDFYSKGTIQFLQNSSLTKVRHNCLTQWVNHHDWN